MLFLLIDDVEFALRSFYESNQNILIEWATAEMKKTNSCWQKKIVEALSIIQNYSILKKLGSFYLSISMKVAVPK